MFFISAFYHSAAVFRIDFGKFLFSVYIWFIYFVYTTAAYIVASSAKVAKPAAHCKRLCNYFNAFLPTGIFN